VKLILLEITIDEEQLSILLGGATVRLLLMEVGCL